MATKIIDFEIADLNLTQQDKDYPELGLSATVTYDIHPAEPDVGIFGSQLDVTEWEHSINGISFSSEYAFGAALYAEIGDNIAEDQEELCAKIKEWTDNEVERIENGDD